jgi:hypothetical protein
MSHAMTHPLVRLAPHTQKRALPPLVVATLALTAVLQVLGRPLQTAAAPLGIVSFELAGTLAAAQAMIASWDSSAQRHAAFSLGLDYLYMPLYAVTIALACGRTAATSLRTPQAAAALGVLLAWGMGLAALLDAAENAALWQVLQGSAASTWPVVARWCAIVKFSLVAAGLLYAGAGAVFYLFRKARGY